MPPSASRYSWTRIWCASGRTAGPPSSLPTGQRLASYWTSVRTYQVRAIESCRRWPRGCCTSRSSNIVVTLDGDGAAFAERRRRKSCADPARRRTAQRGVGRHPVLRRWPSPWRRVAPIAEAPTWRSQSAQQPSWSSASVQPVARGRIWRPVPTADFSPPRPRRRCVGSTAAAVEGIASTNAVSTFSARRTCRSPSAAAAEADAAAVALNSDAWSAVRSRERADRSTGVRGLGAVLAALGNGPDHVAAFDGHAPLALVEATATGRLTSRAPTTTSYHCRRPKPCSGSADACTRAVARPNCSTSGATAAVCRSHGFVGTKRRHRGAVCHWRTLDRSLYCVPTESGTTSAPSPPYRALRDAARGRPNHAAGLPWHAVGLNGVALSRRRGRGDSLDPRQSSTLLPAKGSGRGRDRAVSWKQCASETSTSRSRRTAAAQQQPFRERTRAKFTAGRAPPTPLVWT